MSVEERNVPRFAEVPGNKDKADRYSLLIIDLAAAIAAVRHLNMWRYGALLDTLLDHLSETHGKLSEMRETFCAYDKRINSGAAENLAAAQPFSGLAILEIGGPFGQLLHGLGAESWGVDPDITGGSEFWGEASWEYSPTERADAYHPVPVRLTDDNYNDVIGERQFDLEFSRWVLAQGSGTSGDWRRRATRLWIEREYDEYHRFVTEKDPAEAKARRELFTISGKLTKPGGFVIHEGESAGEFGDLLPELGLSLLSCRQYHMHGAMPIYVFQKGE